MHNSLEGDVSPRRHRLRRNAGPSSSGASSSGRSRKAGRVGFAVIGLTAMLLVSACSLLPSAKPTPTATPTPTSTVAGPPVLVPEGTAAENLPFFDLVNNKTLTAKADAGGRDFIDGLVTAGFPKADMEVTPDTTSIDLAADSIQFSVKWNGSCIIGQHGANIGYHSEVAPLLDTGRCLVGATRPIDW
ncbi:DUF6993 domain-containing protein [Plantibacter sp. Mn2098]|uniref:DUF6993 domain-containing protein n=1 Tax=Plantibacter sp. Mn2098 TaxID=3395266 RepID=UPI003BBBCAA1